MSLFRAGAGIEKPYGYMGEQPWLGYGYLDRVMVQGAGAGWTLDAVLKGKAARFYFRVEAMMFWLFPPAAGKMELLFSEISKIPGGGAMNMDLGSRYVNCEKQSHSQGK